MHFQPYTRPATIKSTRLLRVKNNMTVCFFGSYDPSYSRNKILIDGIKKNGVPVIHCRSTEPSFLHRYPQLIKQFIRIQKKTDVLYVAFMGHLDVPLAWFLARLTGKKVVFDMFYSMYDTYVFDRKSTEPDSLKAKTHFFIDKLAATLAEVIITDTKAHGRFFAKVFHQNTMKFFSVFVGGDDSEFYPLVNKKIKKKVVIEYHGMFTRLGGAEYFIQAAKELENEPQLEFWLIGDSQVYVYPKQLLKKTQPKTLRYFQQLALPQLAKLIRQADVTVGHLGVTQKAKNVISNKTYHGLASGNAVIAIDTPANRELLKDRKTALFVRPGDARDLAKKIKLLVKDQALRHKLASRGYLLHQRILTNKYLGRKLLSALQ